MIGYDPLAKRKALSDERLAARLVTIARQRGNPSADDRLDMREAARRLRETTVLRVRVEAQS